MQEYACVWLWVGRACVCVYIGVIRGQWKRGNVTGNGKWETQRSIRGQWKRGIVTGSGKWETQRSIRGQWKRGNLLQEVVSERHRGRSEDSEKEGICKRKWWGDRRSERDEKDRESTWTDRSVRRERYLKTHEDMCRIIHIDTKKEFFGATEGVWDTALCPNPPKKKVWCNTLPVGETDENTDRKKVQEPETQKNGWLWTWDRQTDR